MGVIDRGFYLPVLGEDNVATLVNANFSRTADIGINVKAPPYNAVGDGVSDDTDALAAVFAAAANTAVYFPPGTYLSDTSIVPEGDNITVRGAGPGASILKKTGSSATSPMFILSDSPNFVMEDMTLDWNVANQASTGTTLFQIPEWASARGPTTFRNCIFKGIPSAAIGMREATDVLIEGCRFQGNGQLTQSNTAVNIADRCHRITVRGCFMRYLNQGVTVTGTNNRDVLIDGNDMEFGWWFVKTYGGYTNSGGTVTYAANTLTDTAATFESFGANARYVRAMPTLASGAANAVYSRTVLTDSTKNFTTAGVLRGHIVRVSGKLAVVDTVGTTTLVLEGWLDSTTYEEATLPSDGTAYTVYGVILGRIESNTGTALTIFFDGWRGMNGAQAPTPSAGTLYEVIEKTNYPVHVVAGNPGVVVSNNNIRRSFSDFLEMQSDDYLVTGNTLYGGQDLGIAMVGWRGTVVGNRVSFMGYAGIDVGAPGAVVSGNTVTDSPWIMNVNTVSSGGIFVDEQVSGALVTGNTVLYTSLYSLQNKLFGIAVRGTTGTNVANIITSNFVSGHTSAGIRLYGTGGGQHTITVADNVGGLSVVGTNWTINANGVRSGTGTPEAAVTAPVGSLFLREDGGASTTLYVKQSGTGNTGWAAK